jgi:hypothetical protein
MLAARLVTMIEKHAEALTEGVVHALQTDSRTPSYHKLVPQANYDRVFDVVSHLGRWLGNESQAATEHAYLKLGRQRFREGIPLAEVVAALTITKRTLRHYIKTEGWVDTALELYQQAELYDLISHFFDRAIYFTVVGYEEESRLALKKAAAQSEPRKHGLGTLTLRKSSAAGYAARHPDDA